MGMINDNKGLIAGTIASVYTWNPSYAAAGYAYDQSEAQVKQQEVDLTIQQREEEVQAKDQEIGRRKRILEILSYQNVGNAASGTGTTGSNRNLMMQSENVFQGDQIRATAMNRSRRSGQNSRASNQRYATRINQASLIGQTIYQDRKTG